SWRYAEACSLRAGRKKPPSALAGGGFLTTGDQRASSASMASSRRGSSAVTSGEKRATTSPWRLTRNFSKFHSTSFGSAGWIPKPFRRSSKGPSPIAVGGAAVSSAYIGCWSSTRTEHFEYSGNCTLYSVEHKLLISSSLPGS